MKVRISFESDTGLTEDCDYDMLQKVDRIMHTHDAFYTLLDITEYLEKLMQEHEYNQDQAAIDLTQRIIDDINELTKSRLGKGIRKFL